MFVYSYNNNRLNKKVYSKVHSICYLSVSGICILSLALGDRMKKNKTNR